MEEEQEITLEELAAQLEEEQAADTSKEESEVNVVEDPEEIVAKANAILSGGNPYAYNEVEEVPRVKVPVDDSASSELRSPIDSMFVSVKSHDIPITDEDKDLYLKATLNSKNVFLEVKSKIVTLQFRTISAYESDVTREALSIYASKFPGIPDAFLIGIAQQYKLSLQLTRVGDKPHPYFEFSGDINSIKDDAMTLIKKSDEMYSNVPITTIGIFTRGLDVFLHKMGRLQEAMFNEDFWSPAGTD